MVQGAVDVNIGANPSAEGADDDEGFTSELQFENGAITLRYFGEFKVQVSAEKWKVTY